VALTHSPPRPHDAPAPEADALFPEARRRRHRRRVGWLLLALGLVLVAALIVTSQNPGRGPRRSTSLSTSSRQVAPEVPPEIVGWTSNLHLVVISSATGATLRTLASNVSVFAPGLPSVSVTPGGLVFFDSDPISGVSPANAQGDQIFSVPITGGSVREVEAGYDPAVSPDGRWLAFVASNGVGEAPYVDTSGGIDIANLSGSAIGGLLTLHPDANQAGQGVSDLSWSSDSQHLSFDLLDPSTDGSSSWALERPPSAGSLASAVKIPVHPEGLTWSGYLGMTAHRQPQGLGVLTNPDEPPLAGTQQIVSIDPSSGHVVRRLFSLPAAVCTTARAPHAPSNCDADFSNALAVDQTGSSVLISGAIPLVSGQVGISGRTYLSRWSAGSTKAVRLAQGVQVATWGPSRPLGRDG
jgi:hypothetical protein